MSEMLFLFHR